MSRLYPRVSPCQHCGLAVLRDNDGAWIHASLSYMCRDQSGVLRDSYAAPERVAPPPRYGPPTERVAPPADRHVPTGRYAAPPTGNTGRWAGQTAVRDQSGRMGGCGRPD